MIVTKHACSRKNVNVIDLTRQLFESIPQYGIECISHYDFIGIINWVKKLKNFLISQFTCKYKFQVMIFQTFLTFSECGTHNSTDKTYINIYFVTKRFIYCMLLDFVKPVLSQGINALRIYLYIVEFF